MADHSRRTFLQSASAVGISLLGGTALSGTVSAGCWPLLERGDSNSAVTTGQYLLNHHGENCAIDGIFGPETESAVESFQYSHGLAVDGLIGSNTWGELAPLAQYGDRGYHVEAAQYNLDITQDGIYGSGTESAVETFQANNGLTVDGIVGPNTWQAMVGSCSGGGGDGSDFEWPCYGSVTSPYGSRNNTHLAIDIGNDTGTPIYAAHAGNVDVRANQKDGCGYYLKLGHDNGYQTMYCHLSSFDVYEGEYVSRGEKIGEMGSTGNSTGPHLHFTIERYQEHQYIPGEDGDWITRGDQIPYDYSGI